MFRLFLASFMLALTLFPAAAFSLQKAVITDCSAFCLPGSSLESIALAVARGAVSLRFGVVMTRDGQVILAEDIDLSGITNAATVFPEKADSDGLYRSLDFSLKEIQQLSLVSEEETLLPVGVPAPTIRIATLADALGFIRLLEKRFDKKIGIMIELKKCWAHRHQGKDLAAETISLMTLFSSADRDNLFIATYDPEELERIHKTLIPTIPFKIQLVQLIDTNDGTETMRYKQSGWQPYNYDWLLTKFGLKALSSFADIIGFKPELMLDPGANHANPAYAEDARMLGLKLFLYPFDRYTDMSSTYRPEQLAEQCLYTIGFDGIITSKSDRLIPYLEERERNEAEGTTHPKNRIEQMLEEYKKEGDTPVKTEDKHGQPISFL